MQKKNCERQKLSYPSTAFIQWKMKKLWRSWTTRF